VALRGDLAAAEGARRVARTENLAVAFEREAPDRAAAQSTVTLSWRPPLDGRRGVANEAAAAGFAAAERRLDWSRLQLRAELRELYARWSVAVERRELLADVSDRIERLAARSRARAASGEDSGLEARRLDLAAASSRTALGGAEAELLRVVAHVQTLFPAIDATRRPVTPALPDVTASLDVSDRPDLAALELEAERAEMSRRLAGRFLELPSLVGGWTFLDEEDADTDGPVIGVEWSIPLFDRGQGERARTRVEADVAHARVELARSRATSELGSARASYELLRRAAVDMLDTTSGSGELIDAATAQFRAEEATLTDLLDAIRSVTEARILAFDVFLDALAAHRALELSAGAPLDEGEGR